MFAFQPRNAAESYTSIKLFHRDTDTTQHTNIRPPETLSHALSLPLRPPTSAWHTSKAPPGRLEERGPCEHGSLPTARTQSLTGHSQSPLHLTAESQIALQLAVHLTFSFDTVLICSNFWEIQLLGDAATYRKRGGFVFWDAVLIHHEMGFISVNPRTSWPALWFGYENTKKCFMSISNASLWVLKNVSRINHQFVCYSREAVAVCFPKGIIPPVFKNHNTEANQKHLEKTDTSVKRTV